MATVFGSNGRGIASPAPASRSPRQGFTGPTAGNVLGAAVGQELGQTSAELIRRGMSIAPSIEIRPGYAFNVMVTQDLVFPGPYDDTVRP